MISPSKATCMSIDCIRKGRLIKINKVYYTNMIKNLIFGSFIFRFVGLLHLKPYRGLCIDNNTMISLTLDQAKILADDYPPFLWIRGPAGSGKTYLLIEKAVALAKDILNDQSNRNEKILVLCSSSILCKALERSIKGWLQAPEATNVSSFLHCKTFTELIEELVGFPWPRRNNIDGELSVRQALRNLKEKDNMCMYDHILVDEGQDLYGQNWPSLLQHMHRRSQPAQEEMSARRRYFWVMYDSNQHLYFGKKPPPSHVEYIQGSAELSKVFRNTDNVFKQSKKYFKSLMSNDRPITLGHGVTGLPIEWDDSLASCSVIPEGTRLKVEIRQGASLVVSGEEIPQGARLKEEIRQGARLVVNWIEKLEKEKVHPKDICVLVQNQEKQTLLRNEIERIGGNSQTADDLLENSRNCAVVESIQRFKGLESKVVILFNPPFQGYSQFCTKELLYAAVSRCSCFLVVISSKEGCIALKSDDGIIEVNRGHAGGVRPLLKI